ncbi:hypothetical protein [Kibdelosporangium aridum]|uniref:hypothetical protein n=1 Tax=Kibdelosporangium aridum TaxID=2030 RepID=UPI0035E81FC0
MPETETPTNNRPQPLDRQQRHRSPQEMRDLLSTGNPMDHSDLLRRHVTVLEDRITRHRQRRSA